jgi:hypothetical protein
LLASGNVEMFTAANGMLFCVSDYSFYYLVYAPIYISLFYSLVNLDGMEEYIFSRNKNRCKYIFNKIETAIIFSLLYVLLIVLISCLASFLTAKSNNTWTEYNSYINTIGISSIPESFHHLHYMVVLAAQMLMLILSYVSAGLLIVMLCDVFKRGYIPLPIALFVNYLFLLARKADLPVWLSNLLPFQYTFLDCIEVPGKIFNALAYWAVCIILAIILSQFFAHKRDYLPNNEENNT